MPSQAIDQAISFLTTPLSRTTVSASALSVLQAHLFASLSALANSGRRSSSMSSAFEIRLRLASSTPPPECIARACEASGVNWSEWLFLIGGGMGLDLDVNIRNNAVTASFSRAGTPSLGLVTVWQQEEPELSTRDLLYADDDSEDLFKEINRSQHSPSWLSSWSTTTAAPGGLVYPKQSSALPAPMAVPRMQPVPVSARSHSRSSSFASSSSSSNHSCGGPSYGFNGYSLSPSGSANVNGVIGGGVERSGSSCSQRSRSSGSNASGSPPTSVYSLSEDGSSGSTGALSWTRRGTVVPGPQQSAIMAARQAHQQQQQQQQIQAYPGVPMINVEQMQHGHRSSPSISSNASVASGSSGGHGKHRRQRSNANVVVNPAKSNVTAYDGGKTKVMTGGVMLGSITSGKKKGH